MGKASRRLRKAEQSANPKVIAAPFIARPFEGLPGETDWVAMREIVPAATARVKLRDVEAVQAARAAGGQGASGASVANEATEVTIVTILPNAWPGLHRDGGELVVAMQSHTTTGDPSRDVAAVILALLASPAGVPLTSVRQADASTPRLQDILDLDAQFEAEVHDSFAFWVSDVNALDAQTKAELADADESIIAQTKAELADADESIIPTVKMSDASVPKGASAYWCRVGERTHIRLLLPHDENAATDALARLHARGEDALDDAGTTRLLGAFRACGLLAPVWDLDSSLEAADYEKALAAFTKRFEAALAETEPLDADGRRARSGLLSRQLTLR